MPDGRPPDAERWGVGVPTRKSSICTWFPGAFNERSRFSIGREMKKGTYRAENGEVRPRGGGVARASMMEKLERELARGAGEESPAEYLERRRLLYVKGLEELIKRAEDEGMLNLARSCLVDLVRLTSLHKLKIEATMIAPGLRRAPSLKELNAEQLAALSAGDEREAIEVAARVAPTMLEGAVDGVAGTDLTVQIGRPDAGEEPKD